MAEQAAGPLQELDALPQPIGEYRPVDVWQAHINHLFYRLRGDQLHSYSQTFASRDYRLAHALAVDYVEQATKRLETSGGQAKTGPLQAPFNVGPTRIIMEWGAGNGNLAACFLTHVKALDKDRRLYPGLRYLLVDIHPDRLRAALSHPDLQAHRDHVTALCANVQQLDAVRDGSVDLIMCNELWNDLPTKLLVKKDGEVEEEHIRPNLSESKAANIPNWSGFVRAFTEKDATALKTFPTFFDDVIWEKEYHKVDWRNVPYRKTIADFLKLIDDQVLVPVNIGAFATLREAKRLLASDAIGFSSLDAGAFDMAVLNDPDKPCYGQFGGQYSFIINFALLEMVATHLQLSPRIEPQREFVGSRLGANVITLMDLLACHPLAGANAQPWELDRLTVRTIEALNGSYASPYERTLDFPLRAEMPDTEREALVHTLDHLSRHGVPDTVAYLTEDELTRAYKELERIGYDRESINMVLGAPAAPVEYCRFSFRP